MATRTDMSMTIRMNRENFRGFPFEVRLDIPNEDTLAAINEVQQMKKNPALGKAYTDVDEMMKELLA